VTIDDPGFEAYGIQAEDEVGNLSRVVSVDATEAPDSGPSSDDDDSDLWLVSAALISTAGTDTPLSHAVNVLYLVCLPMGLVLLWRTKRE
jgi:hypothetical protein